MKKLFYIGWLIISANTFAISPLPQLVAGGVSTWTNGGLMAEGFYGVGGSIANPVILTVIGSGIISLGAAELMNNYWYSNCEYQLACEAAKLNTYGGAIVGTMITVVLTGSTLAMIGGVVGTTVLITIPVFTAAIAGGMSYWWFENY